MQLYVQYGEETSNRTATVIADLNSEATQVVADFDASSDKYVITFQATLNRKPVRKTYQVRIN